MDKANVALAEEVLTLLVERGLTIGTIESFTGGEVAATLVSVPGASRSYRGSLITYASDLKTSLANVPASLIEEHGVVSTEVAEAMAKGAKTALQVDVTLSFTGNAGPTREEGKAPVGRIDVGILTPHGVKVIEADYPKLSRNDLRSHATELALTELLKILKNNG